MKFHKTAAKTKLPIPMGKHPAKMGTKAAKTPKQESLANKLSIFISVVLVVIFTIQITCSTVLSSRNLTDAISQQLTNMAKTEQVQVQDMFDNVTMVTSDLNLYIEENYAGPMNAQADYVSAVYGVPLDLAHYQMEQYIFHTLASAVQNNGDVVSAGAYFEPGKFTNGVTAYSIYLTENSDTKISPAASYGRYSEYSSMPYYSEAVSAQTTIATDPYVDGDRILVTVAEPILYNGQTLGVVTADINISNFSNLQAEDSKFKSLYSLVLNEDLRLLYDSRDLGHVGYFLSRYSGIDITKELLKQTQAGTEFQMQVPLQSGTVTVVYMPLTVGNATWWAVSAVKTSEALQSVRVAAVVQIAICVASLVILLILIGRSLMRKLKPVEHIVKAAEGISVGEFDFTLHADSNDEIGRLTNAFEHTVQNINKIISDMSYLLGEMAEGNFDIRTQAEENYVGSYRPLLDSVRMLNRRLSETLAQINEASDQVSTGSDQVAAGAQSLSQSTTEQAASIEELAATITSITDQIQKSAENAVNANTRAREVGQSALDSNERMKDMMHAMEDIRTTSGKIGKIIKDIEDIAFQTNILALNAAVEAARAGAAGKGFAVVADEVRNLASKSAEASKNTASLIESSLDAVRNGVQIADETAQSLAGVVDGVTEVAHTVEGISNMSEQQANAADQIRIGIDQISNVVQTNSATAEQSAAASEELSGQAQMLKSLVGRFKLRNDSMAYTPEQTAPAEEMPAMPETTNNQFAYDDSNSKY